MKTCPVCALELEDTYLYCPDDGSNLGAMSINSGSMSTNSSDGTVSGKSGDKEVADSTVLYCPACAAEYPLTFSSCPVHHVLLTKHPIPKLSESVVEFAEASTSNGSHTIVASSRIDEPPKRGKDLTSSIVLQRPAIESSRESLHRLSATKASETHENSIDDEPVVEWAESEAPPASITTPLDYWETRNEAQSIVSDRPGFRLAAVVTAIALGILGFIAVSKVISQLTRRSGSTGQIVSKTGVAPQPPPFVATPREAQEYQEPPSPEPQKKVDEPAAVKPKVEGPAVVTQREHARPEATPNMPPERNAQRQNTQTVQRPPAVTSPVSPAPTRASNAQPPTLPSGNAAGFDARLIRIRSSRTTAGVRYDLTFNMQEQGGRMAQWQRVLISTHAASGNRHSEAIPFSHRLGPAGALTFTISVELNGRSEADWRGQIVCTTLGWDRQGAPLQARFGANVAP